METTNYARNRKTNEVVFFGLVIPDEVRARPDEWATWFPTAIDTLHRIGEGADAYCGRNGHRPKRCAACRGVPELREVEAS